ncbi:quinol dehydrogenase periplasmic component [Planctomycetes bacterium CA13]|uniref:Quinol dehydrogenase periplasmic component n=1 Tax=Novipirellula herctigrandis TaxID=2527986 RepID=A0A5C5ZD59_9BACT|nr:quinol dehydrogenase periplasmic component [Planctomycetes bacterium CA13]
MKAADQRRARSENGLSENRSDSNNAKHRSDHLHFWVRALFATRRQRERVRWGMLAVSLALCLPLVPWTKATTVLPALSPFVAIGSLLAGAGGTLSLFGAASCVALVCAFRRRFLCRFVCPLGLLQDCAASASFRSLSFRRVSVHRVPRIGHWLVLMTWCGAACGFPLFLWLDPFSLFSALFGGVYRDWLWVVPTVVIAMSLVLPQLWCTKLCPLGATQDMLHWPVTWRRRQTCSKKRSPLRPTPLHDRVAVPRRAAMSSAGFVLAGGLGGLLGSRFRRLSGQESPPPLRPPGAVDEDQFAALCIRCGNCLQACPPKILRPDFAPNRFAGLAAPLVHFDTDYCREDCHACTQVCPSGAIDRLTLEQKLKHPIGLAQIEFNLCLLAYDKECEICERVCPMEAISFAWSEQEYTVIPQLDVDRCNGCGACVVACPGDNKWERKGNPNIPRRKAITINQRN